MNKQTQQNKLDWSRWKEIQIPERCSTGNCRYCKHSEWQHWSYGMLGSCKIGVGTCRATSLNEPILVPSSTFDVCPCMEYVPGDNLAYLEWKQKRGY